ncbi:bifunctional phosphopantothenoylcysteine decarboxylase/phosphopantothenate--cysteine ligase CoaBC, partial [Campylobacter coli]|nr:bifunctional phosphopantothenoylcysteine decarboxylase/phosphopantothenate--cysteine ligase CoaBC [Campylobacter coli]
GAKVTLLSSVYFDTPYSLKSFESSRELKELLEQNSNKDYLIMAAAVSDFIPEFKKGKIKKNEHLKGLNLHLRLNEDLLKNLNFKGKKIGFKMEFDAQNALENAKKSLNDKKLDMVCLNILEEENYFGSSKNEIHFITVNKIEKSGLKSKEDLAFDLVSWCEKI